ncbi:hypothetical protein PENSPDRAFT_758539 [Peniophora sp. CONT]|nr:hypothetical protein PENSPDRAFT_758539 [Peniophora sp. CONT]
MSATPEAPLFEPESDPDYLAIISRGFDETSSSTSRESFEVSKPKPIVKRQAGVLNSLAYLLLSRAQKQVVAIGVRHCTINGQAGFEYLIAENSNTPETATVHLENIFEKLREVKALRTENGGSPRIPTIFTSDTRSPLELKVIDFEKMVVRYSWAKLKQRIKKNSRHMNFLNTAHDVCGPSAEKHDGFADDDERDLLHSLQRPDGAWLDNVRTQLETIESLVELSEQDALSDTDADDVRIFLHHTVGWKEKLVESGRSVTWNKYTRSRLVNQRMKTGKTSKRPVKEGNVAEVVSKDLDVVRWLSKITSIRQHFLCVADVAYSRSLSPMLAQATKITPIGNQPPSRKRFTITSEQVLQVLKAAKVPEDELDEAKVRKFVENLKHAHDGKWVDAAETTLVINPNRTLHCECLLLTELHGHSAIPFIGVSKLSCAFCDMYFDVYRGAVTRSKHLYTLGTHSQTSNWVFPSLRDPAISPTIRQRICSEFLDKIRTGWDQYSPRGSLDSQSTDASGDVRITGSTTVPDSLESALARRRLAREAGKQGEYTAATADS